MNFYILHVEKRDQSPTTTSQRHSRSFYKSSGYHSTRFIGDGHYSWSLDCGPYSMKLLKVKRSI